MKPALLLVLVVGACAWIAPEHSVEAEEMSELADLIENADPGATEAAARLGARAVPDITPYLGAEDTDVRLVAYDSLAGLGDDAPEALLIAGLEDPDAQIRVAAANALLARSAPGPVAPVATIWRNTGDRLLRMRLALLLGNSGQDEALQALQNGSRTQDDLEVEQHLLAARARLGDQTARDVFSGALQSERGEDLVELIELAAYIDQRWVALALSVALSDRQLAIDLGNHRRQIRRRACDLAIDVVADITQASFSFQIDRLGQYSDDKINEVAAYLAAQRNRTP